MTHGCKAVILDKVRSLLKIRINKCIWPKRANFISHSSKNYLEYRIGPPLGVLTLLGVLTVACVSCRANNSWWECVGRSE